MRSPARPVYCRRRKLLKAGLTTGLVASSGCAGSNNPEPNSPDTGENPDGTNDATVTVIDDFEEGTLSDEWQGVSVISPSEELTYDTSARDNFSVDSGTVGEGEYALRGHHTAQTDDSQLQRSDFEIASDGSTLQFYLRLGPILNEYEQANQLHILNGNDESIIAFDQKDRTTDPNPNDPAEYKIWSEKLATLRKIELKNINFEENIISEVAIDGESFKENMKFGSPSTSIQWIWVHQGHYNNSINLILDEIKYY